MRQAATSDTTATSTFIVRFWREQAGAESRWRGRIEHVQSGQRRDFLCLDQMLSFLRGMGVTVAHLPDGHESPKELSHAPSKEE